MRPDMFGRCNEPEKRLGCEACNYYSKEILKRLFYRIKSIAKDVVAKGGRTSELGGGAGKEGSVGALPAAAAAAAAAASRSQCTFVAPDSGCCSLTCEKLAGRMMHLEAGASKKCLPRESGKCIEQSLRATAAKDMLAA